MCVQRFAENLQIKKAKNETAHVQYLKDQRKNWKGSLFAFLEVARTLQTAVCVCVSLTTLEATLIYSAKNQHQWTANGILFILKKLKFRKSAPLIQKQPSKLTALYRTSYGHAHLLKFKVHFKGKCSVRPSMV